MKRGIELNERDRIGTGIVHKFQEGEEAKEIGIRDRRKTKERVFVFPLGINGPGHFLRKRL